MSAALVPAAGIILAGTFPEGDPRDGLETTLRLFTLAEELGYDVAGIRQRHLERGVSAALPFLAAASQRTRTIRLETDVVPLGYETPFRLAEDFATVDALSGGRVNVGVSTSAPHGDLLADLGRGDAATAADPYTLIDRFLVSLEGHPLAQDELSTPYGPQIPRVQPHVAGLRDRVWLGGGSLRSVRWAAERGLKLLLGNVGDGEAAATFEAAQRVHIDAYLAEFRGDEARVGVERVIVPTDSATATQRAHYAAYVAARDERTAQPVTLGGRTVVFQRDLHGTAEQIAARLAEDPTFDGRTELRVALPYGFGEDEYRQILTDIRAAVLPLVGWQPALTPAHAV
ncbi:LLM class flavin-dependent oxidoreductase [Microbacterium jejuense]|uniref:LLM class flavin-dependent oxidoreductase n=1 Tax=Microbacterium jejuense TaxID=1263637 RepID=UPI0031F0660B